MAVRAVLPRNPAAFCRDIATPAARICYEELQVVAAELPENWSCVEMQGLCRPTHYTGQFPPNMILGTPYAQPSPPHRYRARDYLFAVDLLVYYRCCSLQAILAQ